MDKVLAPYMTSLLLPIDVFEQFEYMILGIALCGIDALWKPHIDVHFDHYCKYAVIKSTWQQDR